MVHDSQPTWQELLDLVTQLDGGSFDTAAVTFGSISVRLSRTDSLPAGTPAPMAPVEAFEPAPSVAAPRTSAPGTPITAPMLGVFFRRPAPGAEPFVHPGQLVQPDTTIGIIEIMKLMNPVTAGVAGTLTAFEVEDGSSVQFGQTLALVDPVAP